MEMQHLAELLALVAMKWKKCTLKMKWADWKKISDYKIYGWKIEYESEGSKVKGRLRWSKLK